VTQEVVGALLRTAPGLGAGDDNASVGEGALVADLIVAPAIRIQLRKNQRATGIGFGGHGGGMRFWGLNRLEQGFYAGGRRLAGRPNREIGVPRGEGFRRRSSNGEW